MCGPSESLQPYEIFKNQMKIEIFVTRYFIKNTNTYLHLMQRNDFLNHFLEFDNTAKINLIKSVPTSGIALNG